MSSELPLLSAKQPLFGGFGLRGPKVQELSPVRLSISPAASSLRMIAAARLLYALPLTLLAWLAAYRLGLVFDFAATVAAIALQALAGALTYLRLKFSDRPVSTTEVLVQLHLSFAFNSAIFFFSGGTGNPFMLLLLLPLAAATSLPLGWMVLTLVSCWLAFSGVHHFAAPLTHPLGAQEVQRLYVWGLQLCYMIFSVLGLIGFMRIVSSTRQYEQMLADMKERQLREESVTAIGTLAAGCAHDLATPLSSMSLLIDEMEQNPEDSARWRANLKVLNQQVALSNVIVRGLLRASQRPGDGAPQAVGVASFMAMLAARARILHPLVTVVEEAAAAENLPPIHADDLLRQAVQALVDNAAQAAQHEVRISARQEGADLVIAVSDDGPGFPVDDLARLGQYRFTTKPADAGSGLGLMLARLTAHRLGGEVEFSNLEQGGACAQMRLPLAALTGQGGHHGS